MSLEAANFHDVYQRYSRDVYRFAFYLTGDAALAEDFTAEAFLRIWAAPAPTHLETVKSYLFAIIRNLYIGNWRHAQHDAPLPEVLPSYHPIDDDLDRKAELRRVLDALAGLDAHERAALLLRAEHGLAYEEIGVILEITPLAARVKVHRARRKLMDARIPQPEPKV